MPLLHAAEIALLKPGNTHQQASDAGKAVFTKNSIEKQWYGFPGHFVGLATHDVMLPKGPIKAGQVVTVEPIVEFPDKQMHFRVEDTILITDNGPEILSSGVPKEISDVEKLVGSAKQKRRELRKASTRIAHSWSFQSRARRWRRNLQFRGAHDYACSSACPPSIYDRPDVMRSNISRLIHRAIPQTVKIAIATAILLRVKNGDSCISEGSFMASSRKQHFGGGPA